MESTLNKIESDRYNLTVEVGREYLISYLSKDEDRMANEVELDGFGRGKSTKDLIRNKVGDQYVLETALDIALQDSLAKTISKEKLEILEVSNLEIKENSSNRLFYTAIVDVFPSITFSGLSGLRVKKKIIEVEEIELNKAFETIATSRSKFFKKTGGIDVGDRAEIDFEITDKGLPIDGGVSKNHPVIVGSGKFIPGFEEQLVGLKIGDEKTFKLDIPKTYPQKNIAGKSLDFKIKVLLVERVEKPVLNDEFARSLGRFSGLDDLRENIKSGIMEEKEQKEKQRLRLEILSKIAEKAKFSVNDKMIGRQLDSMVQGFDRELHEKGMELSIYLAHLNKTEDDLRKDWKEEAERQTRFSLVLKKIAKDQNLKPDNKEVDAAVESMVQKVAMQGNFDQTNLDLVKLRESVANELTVEKTLVYLEKNYTT